MLPSQRIALASITASVSEQSHSLLLPLSSRLSFFTVRLPVPCFAHLGLTNFGSSQVPTMGCIPSKNKVLEADSSLGPHARTKPTKEKKQKRGPPSPIVGEDAAPWVARGHRMLSEKDGHIIITERAS